MMKEIKKVHNKYHEVQGPFTLTNAQVIISTRITMSIVVVRSLN